LCGGYLPRIYRIQYDARSTVLNRAA